MVKKKEKSAIYYTLDEDGRAWALLPSEKELEIKAVHPMVVRRLLSAFPAPEVPTVDIEIGDTGAAQVFTKERDPAFLQAQMEWQSKLAAAMMTRFILDAIVVPEDDEWAEKLRETGVPVPEGGADRQWAYVEEAHIELLEDTDEQSAFLSAVRQVSVPSEAGIEAARRRFRDQLAEKESDGSEDTGGAVPDES